MSYCSFALAVYNRIAQTQTFCVLTDKKVIYGKKPVLAVFCLKKSAYRSSYSVSYMFLGTYLPCKKSRGSLFFLLLYQEKRAECSYGGANIQPYQVL